MAKIIRFAGDIVNKTKSGTIPFTKDYTINDIKKAFMMLPPDDKACEYLYIVYIENTIMSPNIYYKYHDDINIPVDTGISIKELKEALESKEEIVTFNIKCYKGE